MKRDELPELERGAARARAPELGYAGVVSPEQAWAWFSSGAAQLLDVRTEAELRYVGRVPGAAHLSWLGLDPELVEAFVDSAGELVRRDQPLLLLCRSAVRSHHAAEALAAAGWSKVYNVLEGFEGQRDARRQRGHLDGWRYRGLPWIQD